MGFPKCPTTLLIDQSFLETKINDFQLDFDNGNFFSNDAMVMFFFRAPLLTMDFQWFCPNLTITIECFFYRLAIANNVFLKIFSNSDTMVNDGFGFE